MADVTRDVVQAEIYELIRKYSVADDLDLSDASEVGTLGVDSIDLMEIVFRLEEKFGSEIDDTGMETVKVLGDIVDLALSTIQKP